MCITVMVPSRLSTQTLVSCTYQSIAMMMETSSQAVGHLMRYVHIDDIRVRIRDIHCDYVCCTLHPANASMGI